MTPEQIIGQELIRHLHKSGFAIVPIAPTQEMETRARNGQTGTFSPWHLRSLWFSLLSIADPLVIAYLPMPERERDEMRQYLARHARASR